MRQGGGELRLERLRSSVRRVTNRRGAARPLRDAADGDDAPPFREGREELEAGDGLRAGRPAIRGRGTRVHRHDVPEQHVVLDPELAQDAMHDRRGRLGRARAGELALRRERDPRDARATVAGSLPDEENRRVRSACQVGPKPLPEERCPRAFRVLVEGAPDLRGGELVDVCLRRYD